MKPLPLSYISPSSQSIAFGLLLLSILGRGNFYIRMRSARKIISTKIICTNKNYVQSKESESETGPERRRRGFAYEMFFAWVRLTKYRQYELTWDVTLHEKTFLLPRFYLRSDVYSFEFRNGFWILNSMYDGRWCSRPHWVRRLSTLSHPLSQFPHFNIMCFLYKFSNRFRSRVYTCKLIDFANR